MFEKKKCVTQNHNTPKDTPLKSKIWNFAMLLMSLLYGNIKHPYNIIIQSICGNIPWQDIQMNKRNFRYFLQYEYYEDYILVLYLLHQGINSMP